MKERNEKEKDRQSALSVLTAGDIHWEKANSFP